MQQGLFSDGLRECEHRLGLDRVNLGLPTELIRHLGVGLTIVQIIHWLNFDALSAKILISIRLALGNPVKHGIFTADNHLFLTVSGRVGTM